MGMVFQQFNLFPHLTVRENITLAPVKLKVMTDEEADKRAHRAACACRSAGQGGQLSRHSFPAVSSSVSPSRVRWQ